MHRHAAPDPHRRPSPSRAARRRAPLVRAVTGLVALLVLAGCGVRLETPPPVEPSPDTVEQVRSGTVDDALDLARAADALAGASSDEAVRSVLDDVAAFSRRHVEELGGVYDSGLPAPSPTSASPTATVPVVTDVTALVAELVADADRAADDADRTPDGTLARLVASVSVARAGLADRLAAAAGVPLPGPTSDDAVADDTAPDDTVADDAPDGDTGPTSATLPTDAPSSTSSSTAGAPEGAAELALAHDEAAWTFTVLAARTSDATRSAMLGSAAQHRAASDAWARAGGVAGRPSDPRRAAYALPAGLDDPAVADALPRSLEQAVADASARVVAGSPAGARRDAVASLRDATLAAVAWGAAAVPFPGMPELATTPVD